LSLKATFSSGLAKDQSGTDRLADKFIKFPVFPFKIYLMIYIPMHPTIMAVVVAMAGIIFPAITLIVKSSAC